MNRSNEPILIRVKTATAKLDMRFSQIEMAEEKKRGIRTRTQRRKGRSQELDDSGAFEEGRNAATAWWEKRK
jgi:hypothetical protein